MNLLEVGGGHANRMRMDSCLELIRQVSGYLGRQGEHQSIVEELSRLDEILSVIDAGAVTNEDMERIEGSTNQLMNEIARLFQSQELDSLHGGSFH